MELRAFNFDRQATNRANVESRIASGVVVSAEQLPLGW